MILSFKLFERGAGIKVKQGGDDRKSAYQRSVISFVWLWETSHELAQKKVEFHKIMQTAVAGHLSISCFGFDRRTKWGNST